MRPVSREVSRLRDVIGTEKTTVLISPSDQHVRVHVYVYKYMCMCVFMQVPACAVYMQNVYQLIMHVLYDNISFIILFQTEDYIICLTLFLLVTYTSIAGEPAILQLVH